MNVIRASLYIAHHNFQETRLGKRVVNPDLQMAIPMVCTGFSVPVLHILHHHLPNYACNDQVYLSLVTCVLPDKRVAVLRTSFQLREANVRNGHMGICVRV